MGVFRDENAAARPFRDMQQQGKGSNYEFRTSGALPLPAGLR